MKHFLKHCLLTVNLNSSVVLNACNPRTQEVDAVAWGVPGQSGRQSSECCRMEDTKHCWAWDGGGFHPRWLHMVTASSLEVERGTKLFPRECLGEFLGIIGLGDDLEFFLLEANNST